MPRLAALIAEIRAGISSLTVTTNVEGARVIVRSAVVGKSPLAAPIELTAGPADIEAEGYYAAKKRVELPGGSSLTVRIALDSRATTGVLSVRASAAAEVAVDGRRVGFAPIELNVPKGEHRVVVRHPDYRTYETSAVVPAGGTKSVTATLGQLHAGSVRVGATLLSF